MNKKKMKLPTGMAMVPAAIGAGVGLGVGASVLGQMGQGAIAEKTITPAANMMGPMVTAGMGMGVINMMSEMMPKQKKKK
jgi:hypothetical protein